LEAVTVDAAVVLDAMRVKFRCELAPSVEEYVEASSRARRLRGPFDIQGISAALERTTTCQKVFGAFGDELFPAIAIGGSSTVFWVSVATGAVITLHHDATFYEVAATAVARDVQRSMRTLESRGSALGLERLLSLQTALTTSSVSAAPPGRSSRPP
jgi:hypothetical protein